MKTPEEVVMLAEAEKAQAAVEAHPNFAVWSPDTRRLFQMDANLKVVLATASHVPKTAKLVLHGPGGEPCVRIGRFSAEVRGGCVTEVAVAVAAIGQASANFSDYGEFAYGVGLETPDGAVSVCCHQPASHPKFDKANLVPLEEWEEAHGMIEPFHSDMVWAISGADSGPTVHEHGINCGLSSPMLDTVGVIRKAADRIPSFADFIKKQPDACIIRLDRQRGEISTYGKFSEIFSLPLAAKEQFNGEPVAVWAERLASLKAYAAKRGETGHAAGVATKNGVFLHEEPGNVNGSAFWLFREPHHSEDDIAKAKQQLKADHDVVGLHVVDLSLLVLVEQAVQVELPQPASRPAPSSKPSVRP